MNRDHFLAAELFSYSFANYDNHLGIGHIRFEEMMPRFARTLEKAQDENWSASKVADALEIDEDAVGEWLEALKRARAVVDAESPAESFRRSVRFAILHALSEGLSTEDDVDDLTKQICYRASDLSVLLDHRGESLSMYSGELRREGNERA